jgi:response regulator RpfG family c-di-GMP phosphodiesterase
MSGGDFLDRAKDLYPDTFRIALSTRCDPDSILAAINRGAIHRFYTEPWDDTILRDNIREGFRHYWLSHDPQLAAAPTHAPSTISGGLGLGKKRPVGSAIVAA